MINNDIIKLIQLYNRASVTLINDHRAKDSDIIRLISNIIDGVCKISYLINDNIFEITTKNN